MLSGMNCVPLSTSIKHVIKLLKSAKANPKKHHIYSLASTCVQPEEWISMHLRFLPPSGWS